MTELIIFLLATTGLTFITNKSTLFKPLRGWITTKCVDGGNARLIYNKKSMTLWFWMWAEGVLACGMCASIYTGAICASVIYFIPQYISILFPFCATTVITLIFQRYDTLNRK